MSLLRKSLARDARAQRFSFFMFTSSPFRRNTLMINALRVKVSPS